MIIVKLKNKRFILIPLLLCFMIIGCDASKKNVDTKIAVKIKNVKLFKVESNLDSFERMYPCIIYGSKRAKLAFQIPGVINELNVKRGEFVEKGKLIAKLDSRDYYNDFTAATAQLNQRKKDYERQKKLTEKNVVSRSYFEQAERNYEIAKAHYEKTKKAYEDTFLNAPFAGIITELYIENFQNVAAKEDIVYLQDVDNLEARVDLPESDVARIPPHIPADKIEEIFKPRISFAVYKGETFPLTVKEFEAQGDPETHTFKVTFIFHRPKDRSIYPGMTAWVTMNGISLEKQYLKNYYSVPVEAVIEKKNGCSGVWLVNKDMTLTFKKVEVGMIEGGKILVKGVKSGDILVASGANYINPNDKVKELSYMGNKKLTKTTGK
ncbi:efflux RND transporter periplasmic adaptor subunit [Lentisphaerota bacterium WC36G]|nr:efflux RND transporter periplasmic adaptor subunit [Lentisphaerae bacterium WC36]